jgi:hypothetical protein
VQSGDETPHLSLEWAAVVFGFLRVELMTTNWSPPSKLGLAVKLAVLLFGWRVMGSNQELDCRILKHVFAAVTIFTFASQLPQKNHCQNGCTPDTPCPHAASFAMGLGVRARRWQFIGGIWNR